MAEAIDFERRDQARDIYVFGGLTLDRVSERTGISIQSLKKWSADEGWVAMRREYREAQSDIKRYTVLAKLEFIKNAMTTLDPQKAYAFSSLENATKALEGKPAGESTQPAAAVQTREIQTPHDAIKALDEAISFKLNLMLSNPEAVNLKAVKDLKDAMILVDELKTRYRGKEDRGKGLSDETVKEFRGKLLGVRK